MCLLTPDGLLDILERDGLRVSVAALRQILAGAQHTC